MVYRILPYRQGSQSARNLANALGARVLRLQGSTWRPRPHDVVINWGNTRPYAAGPRIPGLGILNFTLLNEPEDILRASNKLNFFDLMSENNADIIPQFWTNQGDIPDDAFPIVCRTTLAGHSGDGIVIATNRRELVAAPLYVKYVKKSQEYRIHVGKLPDESIITIAAQRKARRLHVPDDEINWQVRNHQNGFVYVREGFETPQAVTDACHRAFRATVLDFGAVDVIWNERQQRAYVLEINTAPGLEGQTIEDYVTFFRNF